MINYSWSLSPPDLIKCPIVGSVGRRGLVRVPRLFSYIGYDRRLHVLDATFELRLVSSSLSTHGPCRQDQPDFIYSS